MIFHPQLFNVIAWTLSIRVSLTNENIISTLFSVKKAKVKRTTKKVKIIFKEDKNYHYREYKPQKYSC